MSLRTKSLLLLAATLLFVISLVWFISEHIILKGFERLESLDAERKMEGVREAVLQEYGRLLSTGVDWGSWSETYEFIISGDPEYIKGNLNDMTIANLGMNVILYVNAAGKLVEERAFDLEKNSRVPVPEEFLRFILETDSIRAANMRGEKVSGLMSGPGAPPVLFASLPILNDYGSGPPRGSLVFGRFLDQARMEEISQVTGVTLSLSTDIEKPLSRGGSAGPENAQEGEISVRSVSPTVILGTLYLMDFFGRPAAALTAELPRTILGAGKSALRQFLFLVILAIFGVIVIMGLFFQKLILSRLYDVIDQVSDIGRTKDRCQMVSVSGSDELALLARSINAMVAGIHRSHSFSESLVKTTPIPIMATDTGDKVVEWNPAAEAAFGWSREEVAGGPIPLRSGGGTEDAGSFREKFLGGPEPGPFESTLLRKDGTPLDMYVYPSRLEGLDGKPAGRIAVMYDITEIKKRDLQLRRIVAEKDMLLKEVHHRIKNNLQAISSILDIQNQRLKNRQLEEVFRESQNRIRSMALIHEELHKSRGDEGSRDNVLVSTRQYISQLLNHLFCTYDVDREKVRLDLDLEELQLNIDTAIPCGLIVNELVSNSLKHAFNGKESGRITVSLTKNAEVYRLLITDDGVGFPENPDPENTQSLGMIIVRSLAQQLGSTMAVSTRDGTSFEFNFRVYEECEKNLL